MLFISLKIYAQGANKLSYYCINSLSKCSASSEEIVLYNEEAIGSKWYLRFKHATKS